MLNTDTYLDITHLTTVHSRYDTRIFIRECSSLAKNKSYNVNLIVADGLGDEIKNGINIYDVGRPSGRIDRIFWTTKKVFKKAKSLKSDIYHFHDPELIQTGVKLKRMGKKVIFDIHENVALQIKDKEYLPRFVRGLVSSIYKCYEKKAVCKFDKLILAETSYKSYYGELSESTEVVLNMPDIESLEKFYVKNRKENGIFYIGGISINRGLDVTVEALKILQKSIPDVFMYYIGPYDENIVNSLDISSIKNNIKFFGRVSLLDGLSYSKCSKVGISILKPIDNYTKSYSTKVFEYMAIGLPVVTSNFELYKNIIEKYQCGICVDPLSPVEVSNAVKYILTNPAEAKEMGANGRKAVKERYNWGFEERKLFEIYKMLNK